MVTNIYIRYVWQYAKKANVKKCDIKTVIRKPFSTIKLREWGGKVKITKKATKKDMGSGGAYFLIRFFLFFLLLYTLQLHRFEQCISNYRSGKIQGFVKT